MASWAIRRLQDRLLGPKSESSEVADALRQDFCSLILMTYRRGFEPIGDKTYTSDVNWGCMLRSGQMLFAQALQFQRLRKSWRKKESKPPEEEYLDILELFGDSEASAFSIHNLILAGESYGLAAGSWVGPYANSCSMAIHIISGSEDEERGGAPILCIEDVTKTCLEYSEGETEWTSVLLLVPLVIGLDKVNPRYIPDSHFHVPPKAWEFGAANQVATGNKESQDADTSPYHCNTVRYVPLNSLDPPLALGFYCRNKVCEQRCYLETPMALSIVQGDSISEDW
ncbi:Cysteine protease ATG4b [Raphanus sativus]|nr:Cysteine protease ATG4b [Raphanus sativus]